MKIKRIRAYLRKSGELCNKCKIMQECREYFYCRDCPHCKIDNDTGARVCFVKCRSVKMGEPCKFFERRELQKGGVIK